MSKDSSDTYTGVIPHGVFGNELEVVEETEAVIQEEFANRELLPSVELVIQTIDEEIEDVSNIRSFAKVNTKTGDALEVEFKARERYFEFLGLLKAGIQQRVDLARDAINAEHEGING